MPENQYKWSVVIISCLAIFIIVLDTSAMNVAITTLVVELNTTLSTIQAIIALYALIIASFMLLGSKLQDILGRKKTFMIGLFIYACGTITATLSVNAGMLLIGWAVLEGIGAALILPATTTIVGASYKGKDRITAFGIWGGIARGWSCCRTNNRWNFYDLFNMATCFWFRSCYCIDHIPIKGLYIRISTNIEMERFRYCRGFTFNSFPYPSCSRHIITEQSSKLGIRANVYSFWINIIWSILYIGREEELKRDYNLCPIYHYLKIVYFNWAI